MKVLFDHNVPHKLCSLLPDHIAATAEDMGWALLNNGKLLTIAEQTGLEVMITGDQSISYQQNLKDRKLALIVLSTNNWHIIKPRAALIADALARVTPGSFERVSIS